MKKDEAAQRPKLTGPTAAPLFEELPMAEPVSKADELMAAVGSESSAGLGREDQLLRLAQFALWCLDASRGGEIGDVDGGELQDKATELGILIAHEVTEPCCEGCSCAEYGFPTTCYRQAEWIEPFEIQFGMR